MAKVELLRKIKALAEHGVDDEAENAAVMLDRLMKKYGVTEADLDDEKVEEFSFRWKYPYEERLLAQIVFMVIGEFSKLYYRNKRENKTRYVYCTKTQKIEIAAAFECYRVHLKNGLDNFYEAFIQRENLFPEVETSIQKNDDESSWNMEKQMLYEALEKHTRYVALEAGNSDN